MSRRQDSGDFVGPLQQDAGVRGAVARCAVRAAAARANALPTAPPSGQKVRVDVDVGLVGVRVVTIRDAACLLDGRLLAT